MNCGRITGLVCCALMLPMLLAAKPASSRLFKDAKPVEFFSAMEEGELEAKFVAKDATQATLIVENRTKKPLRIALPATFAGVPVLAQQGGGLGGDFGGGFGGGGGFMNVAPERTQKVKIATVCLEHGKKDPNPRVAYKIVPLKSFTSDPLVHSVCETLGRNKIDQVSAQAAAWHFTDGLTLQQLANKVKTKHLNGTRTMYFNALNLKRASQLVQFAKAKAAKAKTEKSPGETTEDLASADEAKL